ncbi:hypothetical protein G3N95_23335 [Paraburkholderia sp. Tr-20389]|uniref:hypothetical protein n=1 Tax=Paraburkholderia sp. Tr-20389 TaxID=2703903 RepID=UPI0019824152|nr:hypothetical protein [Paraburkholderia sp. Tr-20389]MBN3755898.1 hypothetical protein [Paraburkholderia sp. Tr-20389]
MIVAPDFVDHWKTRTLVGLLGDDEVAPVYVIRLWAHCQQRRTSVFESLPTPALRAICRFPGNAESFESAMVESGFISRDGQSIRVNGWDEYNAALIANWSNGQKGGRPRKCGHQSTQTEPETNPKETLGFPEQNPTETQGVTHDEPIREDKSREDKIGPQQTYVELALDDASLGENRNGEQGVQQPPAEKPKRTRKATTSIEDVEAVFDYWKAKREHPRAKLDAKREKNIRARLADGYMVAELCQAVDGIAKSAFHMGENDQQTVYDDVELICRNAGNVDKFIRLADAPSPSSLSKAGAKTAAAAQRWLARQVSGNG